MFILISPTGEKHKVVNVKSFAEKHGLNRRHIYNVISGKVKQHKGWTIETGFVEVAPAAPEPVYEETAPPPQAPKPEPKEEWVIPYAKRNYKIVSRTGSESVLSRGDLLETFQATSFQLDDALSQKEFYFMPVGPFFGLHVSEVQQ